MMIKFENNPLLEKTLKFSLEIIKFFEMLESNKKYIVAKQLLRSGTSIGANVCEAQNPHSKSDFISKMKIATKELEETKYWLFLCKNSETYPFDEELEKQVVEIGKILYKTLSTSITNNK